jgi:ceramide glucosyltransferase
VVDGLTTLLCFFLLIGLAIATLYYLFNLYAAFVFFRARASLKNNQVLPPVSLLKPLRGLGFSLYENLASFCRLDYPAYQIVFAVREAKDPAVSMVERLRRDFPERDIALVIKDEVFGTNYKVSNLHHAYTQAKHNILVITDGDVRVEPGYLRAIIAPLHKPQTGLVTCLYRGIAARAPAAVVESLLINTTLAPMFMVATQVEKTDYAFGATIAVKRECIDKIGGFLALSDYLADDYYLANLVARAGYRIEVAPHVVEVCPDSYTFRDLFSHQLRWARTYRNCRPRGYFWTVLTHGALFAVVGLLFFPASSLVWNLSWLTLGVRLFTAGVIGAGLLGAPQTLFFLWLVPLADLFVSFLWLLTLRGNTVRWGGDIFRVDRDGKMGKIR